MGTENTITVLGCGNGGMALAADLKLKGAKVALWADPKHAKLFNYIVPDRTIVLHDSDKSHTARLDLVSHNLAEVIQFGNIIYNATPHDGACSTLKASSHIYNPSSLVKLFVNLSGTFSGIDQLSRIHKHTVFDRLKVFDTPTFPYACRAGESNEVTIYGRKSDLQIRSSFFPDDLGLS